MTALDNPFLDAILSDPLDDTVRLVYADWLEENGQHQRAVETRWMVTHPQNSWVCLCFQHNGKCPACQIVPECQSIPRRADAPKETPYVINRGMVSEVRMTLALFLEQAETLFRQFPIERVVATTHQKRPTGVPNQVYDWYNDRGFQVWNQTGFCTHLPAEIWGLLNGDIQIYNSSIGVVGHDTHQCRPLPSTRSLRAAEGRFARSPPTNHGDHMTSEERDPLADARSEWFSVGFQAGVVTMGIAILAAILIARVVVCY